MIRSLAFTLAMLGGAASIDIDAMKHDAVKVTPQNFDTVISKHRDWQASAVLFYKESKEAQAYFDTDFNPVATDLKRMVKLAILDCGDFPVFCKDKEVKEFPSVLAFPRMPMPPFFIKPDNMKKGKLSSQLAKLIPADNVMVISGAESSSKIDKFLTTEDTVPKVLLIHEKKGVPAMYKAMSNEFRKDMNFAFITSFGDNAEHGEAALKRFKASKYPSLILVEKGGKKTSIYKGKMDYISIADWVNLHRETFAKGGGFDEHAKGATGGSSEPKPWLVQEIPEMTKASHNDICLRKEGLCVIYLKDSELGPDEQAMLVKLKNKYTSHLDGRGVTLKWMWMNVAVESAFKSLFGSESTPSVVIVNPHKRLRFARNDDDGGSEEDITKLIEKVMGGDARFKIVKGQKFPAFTQREKEEL